MGRDGDITINFSNVICNPRSLQEIATMSIAKNGFYNSVPESNNFYKPLEDRYLHYISFEKEIEDLPVIDLLKHLGYSTRGEIFSSLEIGIPISYVPGFETSRKTNPDCCTTSYYWNVKIVIGSDDSFDIKSFFNDNLKIRFPPHLKECVINFTWDHD